MSMKVWHLENPDNPRDQSSAFDNFQLELLHSYDNIYHPGQVIEGQVILENNEPLHITAITVQYCGRGSIYWTEKVKGQGARCVDTVTFEAREEYFNITNRLEEAGVLRPGTSKYAFKFRLPPGLPENYEDNLCRIEYFVEARLKIDSDVSRDHMDRKHVTISSPVDLNAIILPDVTLPVKVQKTVHVGRFCCAGPVLVLFLRLSRAGYSPGETIMLHADIDNADRIKLKSISFTLFQVREYITRHKTHSTRDVIVERHLPAKLEYRNIALTIPKQQIFNVTASRIFGIRHVVEMKVTPVRRKPVVVSLDIVLGNIPLKALTIETPAHLRLQPNKGRQARQPVSEFEKRISQPAPSKMLQKNQENSESVTMDTTRLRRKDRNAKVYPRDVSSPTDYIDQI